MSADIASVDDGSLDAPPKEVASELVGTERNERTVHAVSSRRLPTRNSRRSTGAKSGRTTGSSTSTAISGGGRGPSEPSRTATPPHAGDGEAEVHSGARVGQEEVPGHAQARGDGRVEGKDVGLKEDGAEDG